MPRGETPRFTSPDYEKAGSKNLEVEEKKGGQLFGIKRPNMLQDPLSLYRLKLHNPGCKLIVTVRDPVDRFVSAYFHYMNNGLIPVRNIDDALEKMLDGGYFYRYPRTQELFTYGLYYPFINLIAKKYPASDLLVLSHIDLINDFEDESRKVLKFLGLEPSWTIDKLPHEKPGNYSYRVAFYNSLSTKLRSNYSSGRLRLFPSKNRVRNVIGESFSKFAKKASNTDTSPKPELAEVSRKLLESYYQDDKTQLVNSEFRDVVYW